MEIIQDELVQHQNKKEINKLIKNVNGILNDFKKLKASIDDCNQSNKEIDEIKLDVESNIRLLESMLNSNDVDELNELVTDSYENYSYLSSNFKKSLDKDKIINLNIELMEYVPKMDELRISLNESSFKDSVKRELNLEIDSLLLLLDNSQNFDDVEKLSNALNNIKNSYKSISIRLNVRDSADVTEAEESYWSIVETVKAKETNEINYYRSELKFLLSQFDELYKKVPDIESNSVFNDFRDRIKYNIDLIDSSLRLRKIEKLKDKLEQITDNYNSIDSDLNSELENIGKKELSAEFRSELKVYLSKYEALEKKVPKGVNTFDEIRLEINSNIDVIKSSLKFRKIEKLKISLDNAKENYFYLNEKLNDELKNFDSNNNINNLKSELKVYLNKFNELHDKISNMDEKNRNLLQIDKKIELKIDVLKSSHRLRKAEKLQSLLSDVTVCYENIIQEIDVELTKIEYNNHVKELKIQLNDYIPKFSVLKEKISSVTVNTSEIKYLCDEIDKNINVLKSSSRLKKIDKLEIRLKNAKIEAL